MSGIVSIHNRLYTYYDLERDLQELAICYPDSTELTSLGQTLDHRQIYCLRIHGTKGFTKHAVVIQAAMHAREWKNAQLLMMMAERFLRCYGEDILWEGIPYRQLLRHYDVYILPMVNPDGVQISQFGSEGIIDPVLRQELQEKIATQREARRWKGNAKGVDLNRIFTEEALDQPESIVLRDLINAVSPQLTINYHSTGQVIFYRQFFTALEYMSRRTGYPLVLETGKPVGSFGDYLTEQGKKWCTIETGAWEAPVGHMQIYAWWMRQKSLLPLVLASLLC